MNQGVVNDGIRRRAGWKRCLCSLAIVIMLAIPIAARAAVTVSVGPYGWWAWWDPMFKGWLIGEGKQATKTLRSTFAMESRPLYGGALSLAFAEKWSIANVFSIGEYRAQSSQWVWNLLVPNVIAPVMGSQRIQKIDADSTLNYAVRRYLKLFIGLKYQHYRHGKSENLTGSITGPNSISRYQRNKIEYHGISGGLGIGLNIKLVDNLFFLTNISALYQRPIMYDRERLYVIAGTVIYPFANGAKKTLIYNCLGVNATMSLAYYIAPAHITIAAGGRYQYLKTIGSDNGYYAFAGKSDHFYGATLSALFSFDIGKKQPQG